MSIEFAVLSQNGVENLEQFQRANVIAKELRQHLDEAEMQLKILKCHVLGASSAVIQELVKVKVAELGFVSEKKGLFSECKTVSSPRAEERERNRAQALQPSQTKANRLFREAEELCQRQSGLPVRLLTSAVRRRHTSSALVGSPK